MATTLPIAQAHTPARGGGLRRFILLTQSNFLMYVREKSAIFWVIIFPIALMLLFGSIWGTMTMGDAPGGLTFISYLAPGLIVLSLLSNGLVGNAEELSNYREKGILRRIQATPLPVWQLLLSRILMQSTIMVAQAGIMLAVSMLAFNARYDFIGVVIAVPAIVLGAVLFMAMGTCVAAMVKKTQTANVVSQVINVPLMFLGGLWTPIEQLPDWLGAVARYLPTSMVADLVRAPMLSSFGIEATNLPVMVSLVGVLVYLAASIAIATRFFKWS